MTVNSRSKSVPNLEKIFEIDPAVLAENAKGAKEFNDFCSNGGIVRDCYTRREGIGAGAVKDPWNISPREIK
jgi:hypothetical protein